MLRRESPVIRERVIVPEDEVVVQRVTDTPPPAPVVPVIVSTGVDTRLAGLERAMKLWWLFVGTLICLVAFRFCLLLFGVNQLNEFASLILALSQPLVAPFLTLFGSPEAGRAVMELPDFVAVITYLLVGIGVDQLLRLMFAPPDPTGNAYRTTI